MPSQPAEPSSADFAGINALLSRAPGYSVAQKCLEVQAEAERLYPALRSSARVQLADEAWSWYMGAVGEMHVGKLLSQLGPDWFVRHAVPIGTGTTDVDHLLIGPPGVFALNTKHHRRQSVWVGDYVLRVNNVSTKHMATATGEATNVKRRLEKSSGISVVVNSVIVIVGASSLKDIRPAQPRPTSVIPEDQLIGWLQSLRPVLGDGELGLIRLAAEEPTTWHIDPHAADTFRVMQRFERLQQALGPNTMDYVPAVREAGRSKQGHVGTSSHRSTGRTRPTPSRSRKSRSKRSTDELARGIATLLVLGVAWIFRDPLGQFFGGLITSSIRTP